MKNLIYLSRAFVEFGPFSDKELREFNERGLLREGDFFRHHGLDDWMSLEQFAASKPAATAIKAKAAPKKKPVATAPAAQPAARTRRPGKKAA